MDYLKGKNYFAQAADVIEQMGLQTLMERQCNYNTALIQQFFATLVMCGDDARTLKWMTGSTKCVANFFDFAAVLGYEFDGSTAMGHRLHSPDKPDKSMMANMYGQDGVIGTITGLLPLYDQLVRIFRENIAPSGGNNDVVRSSLVNLLLLAQECAENGDPDKDFSVDVMDFIFHRSEERRVGKECRL